MPSDQECLPLREALLRMLDKAISYDVIFRVGERSVEVRCHSFMLLARSPQMQAMLESTRTERDKDGRACVPVPEVDVEIIRSFLRFAKIDFCLVYVKS